MKTTGINDVFSFVKMWFLSQHNASLCTGVTPLCLTDASGRSVLKSSSLAEFLQMSTQLHVGDLSLPSHTAQDICLCCFPALRKLTRSSNLHLSWNYWSPSALLIVALQVQSSI